MIVLLFDVISKKGVFTLTKVSLFLILSNKLAFFFLFSSVCEKSVILALEFNSWIFNSKNKTKQHEESYFYRKGSCCYRSV